MDQLTEFVDIFVDESLENAERVRAFSRDPGEPLREMAPVLIRSSVSNMRSDLISS